MEDSSSSSPSPAPHDGESAASDERGGMLEQFPLPLPGVFRKAHPTGSSTTRERPHTVWKMLGPAFGALVLLLIAVPAVFYLRSQSPIPDVPLPHFAEKEPGAGRQLTAAAIGEVEGQELTYISEVTIGQRITIRGPTLIVVPREFDALPLLQLFNMRNPKMHTADIVAYIYDGGEEERAKAGAVIFNPAQTWMSAALAREQEEHGGARSAVLLRGGGLLFLDLLDPDTFPDGISVYFLLPGSNAGNPARPPATKVQRPPLTGCGDGFWVQEGEEGSQESEYEECEDANTLDGDGCSATCTVEHGWTCTVNMEHESDCLPTACGDGIIARGNTLNTETCDDENAIAGDGCSAACTIESSFTCEGEPSVCVRG